MFIYICVSVCLYMYLCMYVCRCIFLYFISFLFFNLFISDNDIGPEGVKALCEAMMMSKSITYLNLGCMCISWWNFIYWSLLIHITWLFFLFFLFIFSFVFLFVFSCFILSHLSFISSEQNWIWRSKVFEWNAFSWQFTHLFEFASYVYFHIYPF